MFPIFNYNANIVHTSRKIPEEFPEYRKEPHIINYSRNMNLRWSVTRSNYVATKILQSHIYQEIIRLNDFSLSVNIDEISITIETRVRNLSFPPEIRPRVSRFNLSVRGSLNRSVNPRCSPIASALKKIPLNTARFLSVDFYQKFTIVGSSVAR